MDKKKVVWIVVAVVVVILIIGAIGFFAKGLPNGENNKNPNLNSGDTGISSGINKETTITNVDNGVKLGVGEDISEKVVPVEDFELSNISIEYKDGMTHFSAEVLNNTEVDYLDGVEMNVSFFDGSDRLICTIPVMTSSLKAGGTSNITARTTINCSNANGISISLVK